MCLHATNLAIQLRAFLLSNAHALMCGLVYDDHYRTAYRTAGDGHQNLIAKLLLLTQLRFAVHTAKQPDLSPTLDGVGVNIVPP
jgi:predicted ATPase